MGKPSTAVNLLTSNSVNKIQGVDRFPLESNLTSDKLDSVTRSDNDDKRKRTSIKKHEFILRITSDIVYKIMSIFERVYSFDFYRRRV